MYICSTSYSIVVYSQAVFTWSSETRNLQKRVIFYYLYTVWKSINNYSVSLTKLRLKKCFIFGKFVFFII